MTSRFAGRRLAVDAAPRLLEGLEARQLCSFSFKLDYTYDTGGFFTSARRSVLAQAASSLTARLGDSFSAITPGSSGSWSVNFTNPSTGTAVSINNPTVAANTVTVYVGAQAKSTGQLGEGGPAGWSGTGTQAWFDTINTRGQTTASGNAPEYTPYVGFISFANNANWFFGSTASGITSNQTDFYSAAVHELGHVLGIGTTSAWMSRVVNNTFTGAKSKALYGAAVPVQPGGSHWAEGIRIGGKEVSVDPYVTSGTRTEFSSLDFAGLDDIGFDLTSAPVATTGKITGNVFNDTNGDGYKASTDTNLTSWRVYVDKNNNGLFDTGETSALTDGSGNYTLTTPTGTNRVRVAATSGYRASTPASGYYDASVSSGGTTTGKNFGFTKNVLLTGTVFKDTNGDGIKNSGEYGISNWRVFIDANGDGLWQSTETNVLTDGSGNWSIKSKAAGTYKVRVVQQSGYTLKTPTAKYYSVTLSSGATKSGLLFAEKPA